MLTQNSSKNVLYGDLNFLVPKHRNYGTFILQKIFTFKDKIAFINGATGDSINFSDVAQQIVNVSASLTRLGMRQGDIVGVCSENRPEFIISALAAMCSGAIVTFINSSYSKGELVHTLGISRPKFMFTSPKTFSTYSAAIRELNIVHTFIVFGKCDHKNVVNFQSLASKYLNVNDFQPVDFNGRTETALILYSSGTTGPPKGVKLTHANLMIAGMQPVFTHRRINYLSIAPWSNTVGFLCSMREIIKGQTCIYLSKFDEVSYLQAIEKYKAGFLLMVPPLLVLLVKSAILHKYDVSSVELMYSGGAPLDWSIIEEAKKRFPNLAYVLQGYGMTETTGAITEEREVANKHGSVGRVVDGNILKIVDVESRKTLGPNVAGEVCVKGPVLFQGYIGKNLVDELDDEGFYKTGDSAYYDNEGYLFITGRLKELIKYKAWQVPPSELEALILQHPDVKDVGVIGVPDDLAGELPMAFVVIKPGTSPTEKNIRDFVSSKVSPWKQLRGGVKFVDDIPKNNSGKILRRILRESILPSVHHNVVAQVKSKL